MLVRARSEKVYHIQGGASVAVRLRKLMTFLVTLDSEALIFRSFMWNSEKATSDVESRALVREHVLAQQRVNQIISGCGLGIR